MSKFSKPHSWPVQFGDKQKYRSKRYPYIMEVTGVEPLQGIECEACKIPALRSVIYEAGPHADKLSTVFLCDFHERLTRYGKWDQVFRDIDLKIEGKTK